MGPPPQEVTICALQTNVYSPTDTDPDRTNPQAFYFTSMTRPATEGFKDLFSCPFPFS